MEADIMYSWRAKICLISHVGENMEHSFHLYAPDGVSFSSAKISSYEICRQDAAEALKEIEAAASLFRGYDADAAACGTEFVLAAAQDGFDEACADCIARASGLPVVTSASAAVRAIQTLGCGKVALLSPYDGYVQEAVVRYLRSRGIDVTVSCGMDMEQFDREHLPHETADRDFLYKYARSMQLEGADALFICGESLGTMEIISYLERDIGIPVVTSQQALFHSVLRTGGVNAKIPFLGKLMTI